MDLDFEYENSGEGTNHTTTISQSHVQLPQSRKRPHKLQEPEYFHEETVQAKMHTLWQTCREFTCGQARTYWLHLVTFPEGTLAEHYEKLIYSEHRFYMLDQVPFPVSNCELDDMFPELIQQVIRQQNPTQILHARVLGAKNISAQNIEQAIHPTSTYGLPHQMANNWRNDREFNVGYPSSSLAPTGVCTQIRMPIQGAAVLPLEGFNLMNQREFSLCGQNSISDLSDQIQDVEVAPGPECLMLMNNNGCQNCDKNKANVKSGVISQ